MSGLSFWSALWLLACQTSEYPSPILGTTYRIGPDTPAPESEVQVDVLTNHRECVEAKVVDYDDCLPRADRASGEFRFAFRLRDPTSLADLPRAISVDQLEVTHDNSVQSVVELVPHEPLASGQLFVVLIDGSGSMYDNGGVRIRKVFSALLKPAVIEGFFPGGNAKTGVVLLRFSEKVTGLDGGAPKILTDAVDYEAMVRDNLLKPSGGYTHMYGAVRYAVTDLLETEVVRTFLTVKSAEPSIVLVTDGFNNEKAQDTCGDNVARLQETIDLIREVRTSQGGATRPTVFSVGLGKRFRKGDKPPGLKPVTPRDLCGPYVDYRIDGVLDREGIDHVSMQWIAEAGGGRSFVRERADGLAKVLETAAATRYRWYELWYRVPESFYHRKTFEVGLNMLAYARASTRFEVHPNGWIDAPTASRAQATLGSAGDAAATRWHEPTPFRHTLTLLMPALGAWVLVSFLVPALFNTRRALFRRARPRK